MVHGLLGFLLSEDLFWMRLYNLLYLPLLMWGVYRLGLYTGNARSATLATALAVFNFGVAFHLRHLCIDLPAMVLAVLGTTPSLVRRDPRCRVLLAWVVGGMLLSAMGAAREPRYLLPLVPALALLAAAGLEQLTPLLRRVLSPALLLATALPTLVVAGFNCQIDDDGVLSRVLHPTYLRQRAPVPFSTILGPTRRALDRILSSQDGDGVCIILGGFLQENLIADLAPRYPRALLVTQMDNGDAASPAWSRVMAHPRRRVVVSVYQRYRLPQLWQGRFLHLPIYIYELPRGRDDVLRTTPQLDVDFRGGGGAPVVKPPEPR